MSTTTDTIATALREQGSVSWTDRDGLVVEALHDTTTGFWTITHRNGYRSTELVTVKVTDEGRYGQPVDPFTHTVAVIESELFHHGVKA